MPSGQDNWSGDTISKDYSRSPEKQFELTAEDISEEVTPSQVENPPSFGVTETKSINETMGSLQSLTEKQLMTSSGLDLLMGTSVADDDL